MKQTVHLNDYLPKSPPAPCMHYDGGETIQCSAKGTAKNSFPLFTSVASVALETDDSIYRFPPELQKGVCDWCVFSEKEHKGWFIELKGSNFAHTLEQLKSTMEYMQNNYSIIPNYAYVVLSGAHPHNLQPGKQNAILKFKKLFPNVKLLERSRGQAKPSDKVE